jgi:hypothetical protein
MQAYVNKKQIGLLLIIHSSVDKGEFRVREIAGGDNTLQNQLSRQMRGLWNTKMVRRVRREKNGCTTSIWQLTEEAMTVIERELAKERGKS